MRKKFKQLFCGLIGTSLAVTLGLSLTSLTSITSSADEAPSFYSSSSSISVQMFNRDNVELSSTKGSIQLNEQTYNYYSSNWSELAYFKISLPADLTGIVSENSYELSVKWIPEEISGPIVDFEVDRLCTGTISSEVFSSVDEIKSPFTFYIDSLGGATGISASNIIKDKDGETKTYNKNGGWGIYQFILTVNTQKYNSDLFQVKPTSLDSIGADETLQIQESIIRSEYLINNAYYITLKDSNNPYNFIKRNLIQWYVEGESSDGQSYVLLPSHKKNDKTQSLLTDDSSEYVGTSMKFDFDIAGSWNVYCQIIDTNNAENNRTSNKVEFSTIAVIPSSTIIWFIVGGIVVAGIILTIIIVIAKKKEKIW